MKTVNLLEYILKEGWSNDYVTIESGENYKTASDFAKDLFNITNISCHPKFDRFRSDLKYAAISIKEEDTKYYEDLINQADFIGDTGDGIWYTYFFALK